ncbi:uncharacterized protein LOC122259860 [Penaeus japonicus]|uniref:uncharacterized protein LOC122259860 n=1 Tax=Penaeus japonicus TaxID=27405 RepID=UPI001C7178BD|nr:uncharacterized protein LOC122259860 [Penaeus japonicus]
MIKSFFTYNKAVFLCELCSQVMYDKNEAVVHPQNSHHLMKYKEHIRANVAQEIQFMEEKMSALTEYCKRRQVKVSETASDVITEQPTEHSKSCTGLADRQNFYFSASQPPLTPKYVFKLTFMMTASSVFSIVIRKHKLYLMVQLHISRVLKMDYVIP